MLRSQQVWERTFEQLLPMKRPRKLAYACNFGTVDWDSTKKMANAQHCAPCSEGIQTEP